ncbi:hypothetical protein [Paraburkholderia caballeronis]|uniref:hypothetical protein n=1 Tax=Paraburkholderia caballeronis TaxID=416943 RepID=UPI001064B5AE|nr:hypothetical protein [Paraburkholderia caballeronis]TDV16472.1 hypothetical protein C7408_10591 [Paraburkholderia caballeronis]TDV18868.1 hypothetical protein C7406_104137 [Paraburkholderia caballeronis]TDV27001.1 hypothetical protein C7404_10591 [Paraburkholderia caballeronis]
MTASTDQHAATRTPGESRDPATEPPRETSKPIGDAIPTPPEPGLDQPLPPKELPDGDGAPPPP